jgi:hypothetical protein
MDGECVAQAATGYLGGYSPLANVAARWTGRILHLSQPKSPKYSCAFLRAASLRREALGGQKTVVDGRESHEYGGHSP